MSSRQNNKRIKNDEENDINQSRQSYFNSSIISSGKKGYRKQVSSDSESDSDENVNDSRISINSRQRTQINKNNSVKSPNNMQRSQMSVDQSISRVSRQSGVRGSKKSMENSDDDDEIHQRVSSQRSTVKNPQKLINESSPKVKQITNDEQNKRQKQHINAKTKQVQEQIKNLEQRLTNLTKNIANSNEQVGRTSQYMKDDQRSLERVTSSLTEREQISRDNDGEIKALQEEADTVLAKDSAETFSIQSEAKKLITQKIEEVKDFLKSFIHHYYKQQQLKSNNRQSPGEIISNVMDKAESLLHYLNAIQKNVKGHENDINKNLNDCIEKVNQRDKEAQKTRSTTLTEFKTKLEAAEQSYVSLEKQVNDTIKSLEEEVNNNMDELEKNRQGLITVIKEQQQSLEKSGKNKK